MDCGTPGSSVLHYLSEFSQIMSVQSVMPGNHFILCHPLLFPPSIFPSIRVFSNESGVSIRWAKYWSFSFSISSSNEYSGLISFKIDWFDLLAVQDSQESSPWSDSWDIFASPLSPSKLNESIQLWREFNSFPTGLFRPIQMLKYLWAHVWESSNIPLRASIREFPGSPAAGTWHFHCYGPGLNPWSG